MNRKIAYKFDDLRVRIKNRIIDFLNDFNRIEYAYISEPRTY